MLVQELAMLRRSSERAFPEPEDRALADISDVQGMGGRHNPGPPGTQVKSITLR